MHRRVDCYDPCVRSRYVGGLRRQGRQARPKPAFRQVISAGEGLRPAGCCLRSCHVLYFHSCIRHLFGTPEMLGMGQRPRRLGAVLAPGRQATAGRLSSGSGRSDTRLWSGRDFRRDYGAAGPRAADHGPWGWRLRRLLRHLLRHLLHLLRHFHRQGRVQGCGRRRRGVLESPSLRGVSAASTAASEAVGFLTYILYSVSGRRFDFH